jgi:quercetin dioxygenase-like cupin family protein
MSAATFIPPRTGELVGDARDRRVEILCDHPSLHATWSRFGPGRDGADLHVHRRHTDLFYVLSGELTMRLGLEDEQVSLAAGQLVRIPPMVVHGFRNASDADVTYLNLHAPGCEFAEYMRARRDGREFSYDQYDPPEDGIRPAGEAVVGAPMADVEEISIRELEDDPAGQAANRLVCLYVLDGALDVGVGERELVAGEGSWVQIEPGSRPEVSGRARYLLIETPATEPS